MSGRLSKGYTATMNENGMACAGTGPAAAIQIDRQSLRVFTQADIDRSVKAGEDVNQKERNDGQG